MVSKSGGSAFHLPYHSSVIMTNKATKCITAIAKPSSFTHCHVVFLLCTQLKSTINTVVGTTQLPLIYLEHV